MKEFTLVAKKQLTNDVFELHYAAEDCLQHQPGQFVTFILPEWIWGRSYSLLSANGKEFVLIIKRVSEGKKGSMFLCDAKVWDTFKGVWPVGKFVLHSENNSKIFAGTGTGIVPLYNQIVSTLKWGNTSNVCLLFWVRTFSDLFYRENLELLQQTYSNFDYKIALSRENREWYHTWYITDFVDAGVVKNYYEAYLCGAPVVVDAMKEKLEEQWMEDEYIYTEKY